MQKCLEVILAMLKDGKEEETKRIFPGGIDHVKISEVMIKHIKEHCEEKYKVDKKYRHCVTFLERKAKARALLPAAQKRARVLSEQMTEQSASTALLVALAVSGTVALIVVAFLIYCLCFSGSKKGRGGGGGGSGKSGKSGRSLRKSVKSRGGSSRRKSLKSKGGSSKVSSSKKSKSKSKGKTSSSRKSGKKG